MAIEHGYWKYTKEGCRCLICKEAKAESYRKYADKRGIKKKMPRIPNHGTCSEYRNHACRCDDCRKANTEYQRIVIARYKTLTSEEK